MVVQGDNANFYTEPCIYQVYDHVFNEINIYNILIMVFSNLITFGIIIM